MIRDRCRRAQPGRPTGSTAMRVGAFLFLIASVCCVAPAGTGASVVPRAISPMSSGGCNQGVCIALEGSGTDVTRWSTTAVLPSSRCSTAQYLFNGVVLYTGTSKCGSAGVKVSSYWSDPGTFPVGSELCNTWTGVAGRACETIE